MASSVFDTTKIYKTVLWDHCFTGFPDGCCPEVSGTFAADTVETTGEPGNVNEFAVFTVAEPTGHEYPAAWVGTYRLPYEKIIANPPVEIGTVPEPDPDPDPDPDTPADPDTPGDDTPPADQGEG